MITLTLGKWRGLRRLANDGGRFQLTAVDQPTSARRSKT